MRAPYEDGLVEIRAANQDDLRQTCAQVKWQRQSTSHENFSPALKQRVACAMVKEMHATMHASFEFSVEIVRYQQTSMIFLLTGNQI
jgi:glycine cleavage system aminomethyltransferase T